MTDHVKCLGGHYANQIRAAHSLYPPVYTSHHEELFKLLWTLGEGVELARLSGWNHKLFGSLKPSREIIILMFQPI